MQIHLKAQKAVPSDSTLSPLNKITQLSLQLDGHRYSLIKRLRRVFERTNKDILIDFLDMWLEHNIDSFPQDERETIMELVSEGRLEHSITHRKP